MSETLATGEKKDEGVKVTLSLNNEMLAQMISKGIQDLPKEVVHTLSYEALKSALQDKEFLKHLMFVNKDGAYNWWEKSELRQWVVDLLSRSFTDDEVRDFRDGVMRVLRTDHREVAVEALANAFMRKVSSFDFDNEVRCIVERTLNDRERQ